MFQRLMAFLAVAFFSLAAVQPAKADWRRAESARFIVYGSGSEASLRDYVQKLESFDRALRLQMGVDPEGQTLRKLPVYLAPTRESLLLIRPDLHRNVAGFYASSEEDIYAVADTSFGGDIVVFHEYAHHFMMQYFPGGYPGWFVEGFADYYSTADIAGDRVMIGRAADWRVAPLQQGQRMELRQLLASRQSDVTDWRERPAYYPTAWLLTHYFFSDDARREQLSTYLAAVARGADPVEAMTEATGLSLEDLDRALTRHLNSRMPYYRLNADFPRQPVEIERLPPSADTLLLINQRLKTAVKEDERAAMIAEIRRLTAPLGDDPLALLTLGHAELHSGDRAAGEAILTRLLEIEPAHVEALQLMASGRMMAAAEEGADADKLMGEAQGYLMKAFQADPANYTTLVYGLQTREGSPGYPSPSDLNTWIKAYRLAPQLPGIRIGAAQALLYRDRDAEGLALLAAVAGNPHGGGAAERARHMIANAKAGVEVTQPVASETPAESETPEPATPETGALEPAE